MFLWLRISTIPSFNKAISIISEVSMAANVKRRVMAQESLSQMSEGDVQLQKDLLQLVEDIIDDRSVPTALSTLRKLMRMSTTSMTAVPKPLKYLKDSYGLLKQTYANATHLQGDNKKRLADIISVLAVAAAPQESLECLRYCLEGTMKKPGDWGYEYIRRLEIEIVDKWSTMPLARENDITKQLLPLAKMVLEFDALHHAEIQACDLCLEIDQLHLLKNYLDKNNYSKICLYLASCADYTEDLERREVLTTVTDYYLRFQEYSKAILIAMQLPDSDLVHKCLTKCENPLVRKQLAHILARQKDQPMKKTYSGEDAEDIGGILSNGHINEHFRTFARELDIMEPKTPEEIYKTWLESLDTRILEFDSARANLASTFASAFVHAGFGVDKIMCDNELGWVYKNKDHGMLSATASLGLIHMWDADGGLSPIDKYLYANNDFVKSGALLAIGLVNCGVRNECDPAMALLSEHVMSPSQDIRIGAILGLGLAYTASNRKDLNDLLIIPLADNESTLEVAALSAISLGLINVGSGNGDISSAILQRLMELVPEQLSTPYSRFFSLALGLLYISHRDNIEAISAALDVLPSPYKLPAQTMIQVCSYAGTGDVLMVQEFLRLCSEPVESDGLLKSSTSVNKPIVGCCDPQNNKNDNSQSNDKKKAKNDDLPSEIALTQPIASLGVAVVGLGEGKENARIFGQIGRYGSGPARVAVPLSIALTYLSNPDIAFLDVLNKYSHDSDPNVAMNAIFSLGLVGAGTNNARLATMLRQLAAYYGKNPTYLFLIRIAQGLVHLGKGTITLQPMKFSSKVLDKASLAGLMVVLVSFLDCKNLILGKSHYLLYCLSLAMEPRWLVTLNENLEQISVSVRVGKAVDVIGKAGDPKSVTGGHVRMTPVLMSHGEKAELVSTEEFEPLVDPMEGFVILRAKIV